MNFESLTNARPVRQRGKVLTAMPPAPSASKNATGSFKMTEELANVLKLAEGNYVDIVTDKDNGGFYITKGVAGDTDAGIKQNGSKLGKSGSVYKFSAAKVWVNLGENNAQVEYSVGEAVEVGGKLYFPLEKGDTIEVEQTSTKPASTTVADEDIADSPEPVSASSSNLLDEL